MSVGLIIQRRSDMEYRSLSDLDLLKILLGERAAEKAFTGSVMQLFLEEPRAPEMHPRIGAARELVKRALCEELRTGSVLSAPATVRDYLRLCLSGKEHEAFLVVCLDAQHRVIEVEEVFRGTLTHTSVYPREIVKYALRANAAAVIFAHNHPSGVAQPSQADELLTRNLKEALALVEVKVLDHFIVAGNQAISFAERGLL
jgi:DNA repair protein RadC